MRRRGRALPRAPAAPGPQPCWPPSHTCWLSAPRSCPRYSATGRASSTCASSRRCAVLADLSGLRLLVVDGHADLDPDGRPGLGAHARAEFGIPVIGVARSRYRTAIHAVPVQRGSSARPLFVIAAGMPTADAADLGPAHDRPVPAARCPAPRRHPRAGRSAPERAGVVGAFPASLPGLGVGWGGDRNGVDERSPVGPPDRYFADQSLAGPQRGQLVGGQSRSLPS